MIFFWENAKVITNFTTNWCCNECDQWHEAYKNTRNIIKFTTWELQRYITNHKYSLKNAFNSFLKSTNYIHCHIKLYKLWRSPRTLGAVITPQVTSINSYVVWGGNDRDLSL